MPNLRSLDTAPPHHPEWVFLAMELRGNTQGSRMHFEGNVWNVNPLRPLAIEFVFPDSLVGAPSG